MIPLHSGLHHVHIAGTASGYVDYPDIGRSRATFRTVKPLTYEAISAIEASPEGRTLMPDVTQENANVTNRQRVNDSPGLAWDQHENLKTGVNGVDVKQDRMTFLQLVEIPGVGTISDQKVMTNNINPGGGDGLRVFVEHASFEFNGVPVTNQFVQVENAHHSTNILMIHHDHEVTFLQRPDL